MIDDIYPCARCRKTVYDRRKSMRHLMNGPMACNEEQADAALEPACECTVLELFLFQNSHANTTIPSNSLILIRKEL